MLNDASHNIAMIYDSVAVLRKREGEQLEPSEWLLVDQEMINAFAAVTNDTQWVHIDEKRAKIESPFGGTIAHGFLTLSLLSKLLLHQVEIKSLKMGVNYGLNRLRFTSVVPSGSRIRLLSSPKVFEDVANYGTKVTFECKMEIEGVDKPALVGEFMVLFFE